MKSNRLNLCVSLRNTLTELGYSTVKAVNAVNAALGELKVTGTKETVKMGDGRITKTQYKVTETETIAETYAASSGNIALRFDAFNSQLAKLEKIAELGSVDGFGSIALPETFTSWLDKFAKAQVPAEQVEA